MAISGGGKIRATLASGGSISGSIASGGNLTATLGRDVTVSGYYGGPYEVTPSGETQILAAAGRIAERDIIVNPIPSNYGRITWDGSVLTVS